MAHKYLKSVFTDDMDHCYFTGSSCVERHHIFGGANRNRSEKYGYTIPLRPDIHPNGVSFDRKHGDVDIYLKRMAQKHYENNHGSRQDFIKEFGRSWL